MKNLSMEDVYGSHHTSSTITRFTSLSENIVLTSSGQEESAYLAEVLGHVEKLPNHSFHS